MTAFSRRPSLRAAFYVGLLGAAIFVIALIVILAVLVYGFAWGHWFNVGGTVNVVTSPGGGGASPLPSISPSK